MVTIERTEARAGRRTALSAALRDQLVAQLVSGASLDEAASAVGVTSRTLRNWLEWGEESPNSVYGEFVRQLAATRKALSTPAVSGARPRTAKQLNDWFAKTLGFRLPERAVCPGHDAPIDVMWDIFANLVDEAIILASRSAGKTLFLAMLAVANQYWKPGHTTTHYGSVENQAKRAYAYYSGFLRLDGIKGRVADAGTKKTTWLNGAEIEILPGTEIQTQGPHTHMCTWDELESGKRQPYENARGIPIEDPDGNVGQFVTASTRQKPGGLMQQALDDAPNRGARIYTFCVWETIQPTKIPETCKHTPEQHVDAKDRTAFYCPQPLAKYTKGIPTHRAKGWRSIRDVMATYRRMSVDTFETQVLNLRPEAGALIYPNWTEANISEAAEYVPGEPIVWAYDAGYNDATYIGLAQIRNGALHLFDEVTGSHEVERHWIRKALEKLVALPDYRGPTFAEWLDIFDRDKRWPRDWGPWPHASGDPSAAHMRYELKNHGITASPEKRVRHLITDGQSALRAAIASDGVIRFYVHPRCTTFIDCVGKYQAQELPDGSYAEIPSPEPSNHKFSHALDAVRYLVYRWRRELGLPIDSGGGSE